MVGHFPEEVFELDTAYSGFELDTEVAKRIADNLFAADEGERIGNLSVPDRVFVDPLGSTVTHGFGYHTEAITDELNCYRVSFSAVAESTVNEQFGRELKAAFLDSERRCRRGRRDSLAVSAGALTLGAMPLTLSELATRAVPLSTGEAAGSLSKLDAGIFASLGLVLSGALIVKCRHAYIRERTTRPGSRLYNNAVLKAGSTAYWLNEHPVITFSAINDSQENPSLTDI